jgi:hypothetical protein
LLEIHQAPARALYRALGGGVPARSRLKTKGPADWAGPEGQTLLLEQDVGGKNVVTMNRDLEIRVTITIHIAEKDVVTG